MQTIDRPTSPPRRSPPWAGVAWTAAGVLAAPLLLLAVFTRWGVLVAVLVALVVGLGIWVWQRGFVFVEIVAFLIHFDGLGFGQIRMGRGIAGLAAIVLVYKLVKGWKPPAVPLRHWAPVWALTHMSAASAASASPVACASSNSAFVRTLRSGSRGRCGQGLPGSATAMRRAALAMRSIASVSASCSIG